MVDTRYKRQVRYRRRILGTNGKWFSTMCPPQTHGRRSGYDYWGCRCDTCVVGNLDYQQLTRARKWHNFQILQALIADRLNILPEVVEATAPAVDVLEPPKLVKVELEPVVAPVKKPAKRRRVATPEPEIVPGRLPDGQLLPPIIDRARDDIRDVAHLQDVAKAYWKPEVVRPGNPDEKTGAERELRVYGEVEIVVAHDEGEDAKIIAIFGHQRGVGEPTILTAKKPKGPRVAGRGRGRTGPVDQKGLLAELEKQGVKLRKTGSGHIVAERDGATYTLGSTPSDYRSVKNTVAGMKKAGVLPA